MSKINYFVRIKKYFVLVKFSHTIFAMPFAVLGFFLGIYQEGKPFLLSKFLLMIVCMVSARNVAMAFNRLVDADIDMKNGRTQNREIPKGELGKNGVGIFITLNVAVFYATTYFINSVCFKLAWVALVVVLGYSLTKRFTWLCHIVLGIGLGLAPIGSFLVVTSYPTLYIVLLGCGVVFWVSGFDIIYALQDWEFDSNNGLFSIPVFLGKRAAKLLAILFHIMTLVLFVSVGLMLGRTWIYFLGCAFFAIFLLRQHRRVDLEKLDKIEGNFFLNNGIASLIFGILCVLDLVLKSLQY